MRRQYTPAEDALIMAARTDELEALSVKLGRKRFNILNRRNRLLRGDITVATPHRPIKQEAHKVADVLAGRPDWFTDEKLHSRLRARR